MKKVLTYLALLAMLLSFAGCATVPPGPTPTPPPTIQSSARDASAALNGLLVAAQTQYLTTCKANPTQTACQTINRGIAVQNILITADQAYCGWSATVKPTDPNATCVPVQGTSSALNTAISDAAT